MADDDLVTIRRCGPVWEAEMIRDRLEAAGLRAFVQGTESHRTLSYVGGALGGVQVQVPAEEVDEAERILLEDERQRATAGSWVCPRCDEPNDASFDLCWSCAMPRGDAPVRQPVNEPPAPPRAIPEGDLLVEVMDRPVETLNPYQSSDTDRRTSNRETEPTRAAFEPPAFERATLERGQGLSSARGLLTLLVLIVIGALVVLAVAVIQAIMVAGSENLSRKALAAGSVALPNGLEQPAPSEFNHRGTENRGDSIKMPMPFQFFSVSPCLCGSTPAANQTKPSASSSVSGF